jgi:hypothetical protein
MRTDYRNEYKGWDNYRIEKHLIYLKEKLSQNIGVCDSNVEYYLKRISYLEIKINK